MQFKTYLKAENIKQTVAAKALGLTDSQLSKILSGEQDITLMQVNKIYDYSKKQVTYWDWMDFYERLRSEKKAQ